MEIKKMHEAQKRSQEQANQHYSSTSDKNPKGPDIYNK